MTAMGPELENMVEPFSWLVSERSQKAGLPPCTPVFVGQKKASVFSIDVIDHDSKNVVRKERAAPGKCLAFKDTPKVTWINDVGLHDTAKVEELGKQLMR